MSNLIVTTPEMHKITDFKINVKYFRPGNVVAYTPVEFEIFINEENVKAIPLPGTQNQLLINLPNELMFQIKDDKICNCKDSEKEIVEDIVSKLVEMTIVKTLEKSDGKSRSYVRSIIGC